MIRVEFRLSMPSRGSWNGGWSGAERRYVIVRALPAKRAEAIVADGPYFHHWSDGWAARIDVRIMERGERAGRSDGFSGYDWMVANILAHGQTADPAEVPA